MNTENSLAHFSAISEDKPPMHGKQDSKRNKLKSTSVLASTPDKDKIGDKTIT